MQYGESDLEVEVRSHFDFPDYFVCEDGRVYSGMRDVVVRMSSVITNCGYVELVIVDRHGRRRHVTARCLRISRERRYGRGETQVVLGKEYGVSKSVIHNAIRKAGGSRKRKVVDDWKVDRIREMHDQGVKVSIIAKELKVNYQTAMAIAKGNRR